MATKREHRPDTLREVKTDELSQKLAVLTEEKFRLEFRRATESLALRKNAHGDECGLSPVVRW